MKCPHFYSQTRQSFPPGWFKRARLSKVSHPSRTVGLKTWMQASVCVLSCKVLSDSAAPWTVARQAALSMGFSRQECWCVSVPSSRGSSQLGDRTYVFCIGRWVLYHWAPLESPSETILSCDFILGPCQLLAREGSHLHFWVISQRRIIRTF